MKAARLVDLGVRDFAEVWKLQLELVGARQRDEIPDTLLFVEHPHVITAGRSAKRENLLDLAGTPLFEIERGRALARFGLPGARKPEWTGVWTADGARKLASIGVAVKRWVTMHGFALNVATDLGRFAAINPCGLDAAVMASMAGELGRPIDVAAVKDVVRGTVADVFGRNL